MGKVNMTAEALMNYEAEEKILGFLFNPLATEEEKNSIIAVLQGYHFTNDRHISSTFLNFTYKC